MRSISTELAAKLRLGAVVFAERGYDASTIDALSEATGVPSSTLYYNFAGKQEILTFLMQDWLDRTSVVVTEAIEGEASAAIRLERVIGAQLTAMANDPSTCQMLLAELGRIDRLPHIAEAVRQAFHRPVAKLLVEGAADGSLAEVPIENATAAVYGAVTLTGLHHVVAGNGQIPAFDVNTVAADVVGIILNGPQHTNTNLTPTGEQPMTDLTEATAVADHELLALFSDPDTRANPYPSYQRIREAAPIHKSEILPMWVVTRYQDCATVLRDNRFGKGDNTSRIFGNPADADNPDRPVPLLSNDSMLRKNPPDHTRLRGLVAREFTPRRVEELRPAITDMVKQHLDGLADNGGGDVMDVLAFPLPVQVIGELLGVPESDREQFRYLVRDAAAALEPMVDAATTTKAQAASHAMTDYFTGLLIQRRQNPGADLISALIQVQEEGDRLNDDELIATIILLFAAGFETTTNLIGNGLVTLLQNRDQLELLRTRPDLAHGAVEEILRYESSVQLDARVALEPADIDGCNIAEGDVVLTLLGAANRDPDRYADPDRFNITRPGIQHLSFAAGIHFCLGAPLARLEGEIVFNELLQRFAHIDGDVDAKWRPSLTLRGLETLDITVS